MTSIIEPASTNTDDVPLVEAAFLSPADLDIEDNIRENFNLDDHPEERESIRQRGVRAPILATREPDGRITVTDGQIRVLIALVLGVEQVPVWIERAPDLSPKQRQRERIIDQINLNDRRIPLTDGDRASGVARLLHLGLSVTRVAEAAQEKDHNKIRQAARIGTSATARKLVDDNQLDFEQAAILADFEANGDTEAVQRLLDAPRHYFAYEANLIARQRAEARALFEAALPYAASGFAIATDRPDSIGADPPFLPAEALCTSEGQPVTPELLSADAAEWVVYLEVEEDGLLVDRDTGEIVDPETVDPNTKGRPEVAAADGYRHAETTETRDRWTPHYFLPADKLDTSHYQLPTEPEPEPVAPEPEPAVTGDTDNPAPADNPDVVEDLEAARAAREQARAEQQAREAAARQAREEAEREAQRLADLRKKLTAMFATATTTRREWVQQYLVRGSVGPHAIRFILEAVAADRGLLDSYEATKHGLRLLGIDGWRAELEQTIEKARPGRYAVILLGLVCGAYESRISKDAWGHNDRGTRHYLHFLAEIGHTLTDTEHAAAGDLDPVTIPIDT
ncbi:ParB N-terminal domain-containing protein [Nocardia terpenica]|uniref:ParB/RepB/Spo0J family partition protein n=1 Tax=Nocardia terpenica TaxID=455432 RepID=UPI001893B4C0|nr:ParB N-terminal domain-containing protein [Nocardia terpenica]MBF6062044.1 ParB N-terminal domain-containing protein [Nocardia terpenica]MBF6106156.1 ParB N-terminal domain-containing protein [Nocardia terpenica]MBF6110464.1 ParB N-terminal domain-containing protein [Nocardia terpenica]MBF6120699.1 ParB N-terminal domain-containing protein [Nocardia terpenica]MBF6151800.1 ParB N-terminal domain-containing protein [Nocardia terpenica]